MTGARWYISAAAVRCYQRLQGYPFQADGEWFDRAEAELAALCAGARLMKHAPPPLAQAWRVKALIRGKMTRLELSVSTAARPEGPLAQLIHVRTK